MRKKLRGKPTHPGTTHADLRPNGHGEWRGREGIMAVRDIAIACQGGAGPQIHDLSRYLALNGNV